MFPVQLRQCAIGFALSLLQCTANKPQPVPPSAHAPEALELEASSIQHLEALLLGNRVAFKVDVCADPKLLRVSMDKLWPAIASDDSKPVARVTKKFEPRCQKTDELDSELQAKCEESSKCQTLYGIVDKPGPTTVQFLRASKSAEHAATVVARITLNLPNPNPNPTQAQVREIERGLSDFYWDAEGRFSADWRLNDRSRGESALFSPWLSSNHVLEVTGKSVLAGQLDPEQAATVPAEVVLPWVADRKFDFAPSGHVDIPGIARFVPREAAWVRFANAGKLTETLDRIEDLASGAMLGLEREAKDRKLRARYSMEIGIEEKALTKLFADGLADDMALLTHDLSLRDGTDLTLVIHLVPGKNGAERLRQSIADVGERTRAILSKVAVRTRQVELVRSAGGSVNSHMLFDGNWALVSNSSVALARVLDTSLGLRPSVAAERDYRYLRGLGGQRGDGTLHMGAAFWEAQLSAAQRVEHRRRLLCAGEMQALSNAVLSYRRDRGQGPDLNQLISARYLLGDDLRCPDGGEITLENDSPHCTVHGTLGALSPVVEHLPRMIKPVERDGYRAYFASLTTGDEDKRDDFGKAYMMPVDVEFTVGTEFVAKARALPDEESELFTKLRSWFGKRSIDLASKSDPPGTVASGALVLDSKDLQNVADWLDLGTAEKDDFGVKGRLAFERWLTGQAQFYVGDGAPPISMPAQGSTASAAVREMAGLQLGISAALTAMMAPISGVLALKDVELAREAIDTLISKLGSNYLLRGSIDGYQLVPYRNTVVRVLSVSMVNFHLYYAFVDNSLIFSNRKPTMLALIGRYVEKKAHLASSRGQVSIELFPKQIDASLEGLESAWQERLRGVCHQHLTMYERLTQAYGPKFANDPLLLRKHFGFDAKCPEGGHYRYDPLEGGAYCTVHGRYGFSRQPTHLSQHAESSRLFRSMKYVGLSLATTDRTLEAELRIEHD